MSVILVIQPDAAQGRVLQDVSRRIGAELVPGDSEPEPEPAAPKAKGSGCVLAAHPPEPAPLARAVLPALLGVSLWRRRRRQNA